MKIVIAPNAFKGCLSSTDAAVAMEKGIKKCLPDSETVKIPISDGGDGLSEVVNGLFNTELVMEKVNDPLGRKIEAAYSIIKEMNTAVIEMALASGLALLRKDERDPMAASTYGTGELIASAVKRGAKKIILGIGGSATCDGATGAASATGWRFLDANGGGVIPCGTSLTRIRKISFDEKCKEIRNIPITVVCDVENNLLGEKGAARVFAPQKGASPEEVEILEEGLANLAEVIRRDLGIDVCEIRGGGAAGGMGAGMKAFFNAELRRGTEVIFSLIGLEEKLADADLVLTGEGRIDEQTIFGKAPAEVAKLAKKMSIPCIAICGSISGNMTPLHSAGMSSVHSICKGSITLDEAMRNAAPLLSSETERVIRKFLSGSL